MTGTATASHPVIDELIDWDTIHFQPIDALDADRRAEITASMEEHGWVGAPIVVDGDQCITGSHRIQAAVDAGLDRIPVVDVANLAEVCNLDWQALRDAQPMDGYQWYGAAKELANLLPRDVVDYLGLDVH